MGVWKEMIYVHSMLHARISMEVICVNVSADLKEMEWTVHQ